MHGGIYICYALSCKVEDKKKTFVFAYNSIVWYVYIVNKCLLVIVTRYTTKSTIIMYM